MSDIIARYALLSDKARDALGEPTRIRYGSGTDGSFDLYRADRVQAPIVIFVHGGAWRDGAARDYAFPAEMLVQSGIHYIALDFSPVTAADGDLSVLIDQIRRGVLWAYRNCTDFGGDPSRIYLVGHSTGAHLAALALTTHWPAFGIAENPTRGGMCISGIYDLAPIRSTSRTKYVRIDDDCERLLSPIHFADRIASPLLLAFGSNESPEYKRQAQEFERAALRAGKQVELIVAETYNHFEIAETLASPFGLLGRTLLKFMAAHTPT